MGTEHSDNRFANLPGKPYEGAEPYIFVSYKHDEWPVVFPVIRRLINDGYRVWYDEGIEAGSEWRCSIQEHVENCSVMLPFLSDKYCNSKFCRRELSVASDDDKVLVPIILEKTQLGNGVRLLVADYQGIVKYEIPDEELFYQRLLSFKCLEVAKGAAPPSIRPSKNRIVSASAIDLYDSGMAHYYGNGAERNYLEALQLLNDAIDAGLDSERVSALGEILPRLHYWVGRSYADESNGSQEALAKAVEHFEQSADLGDPYGLCELGRYYREGRGVQKDVEKAAKLTKRAAQLGDYGGNYDLGVCYDKGLGVERSPLLAANHYKKASSCTPASDYAKALTLLKAAECYVRGGNHAEAKRCVETIEDEVGLSDNPKEKNILKRARTLSFESIEVKAADYTTGFSSNKESIMIMYKTTAGDVVYDMDLTKEAFTPGQVAYLSSKGDAGLRYILRHGYPFVTYRNNRGMDAYITQMAIWWYLSESLSMDFRYRDEGEDPYGLAGVTRKLVEKARAFASEYADEEAENGEARIYTFLDSGNARVIGLFQ